jgi:acetylornithine/succinyldiaminopimelate/putrescine aminotransferase
VIVSAQFDTLVKPGHHGTTFGGNPIACRLGLAVLHEIRKSHLLDKVQSTGKWFEAALKKLQKKTPAIVEIRGKGLMWGIELDRPAAAVAKQLLAKGFVVGTARDRVLRLLPPFIVPKKALKKFIAALEQVLASATEIQQVPIESQPSLPIALGEEVGGRPPVSALASDL